MDLLEILKLIGPVLGGTAAAGLITGYFAYKAAKPKNNAEAQKINADVVVTFAEGWRQYSEKLEKRVGDMEKKTEDLEKVIDDQEAKYKALLEEKDGQIAELMGKVRESERRIRELEEEVKRYKQASGIAESVRADLHQTVDTGIDQIQGPPPA